MDSLAAKIVGMYVISTPLAICTEGTLVRDRGAVLGRCDGTLTHDCRSLPRIFH